MTVYLDRKHSALWSDDEAELRRFAGQIALKRKMETVLNGVPAYLLSDNKCSAALKHHAALKSLPTQQGNKGVPIHEHVTERTGKHKSARTA